VLEAAVRPPGAQVRLLHEVLGLLLHSLPAGGGTTYATISGTVELSDDPGGSFHQVMYDIHMGGATPPPEPGAQRVIARLTPTKVYESPWS
jgi:hypothetical protein